MKKNLLVLLSTGLLLVLPQIHTQAQDEKLVSLSITITEDGEVTTDTTIELKNGHDAEMIKKIVTHMTGEDIDMDHSMSMSHSKVKVIHADEDMVWHSKKDGDFEFHFDDLGIDLDSVKKAHGGQKIIVMKDGEGDDHMVLHEDETHGKHKSVRIIIDDDEEGEEEDVEVYVIKKGDKDVKVIERKIRVEVEVDDDEAKSNGDVEKKIKKKK